MTDNTKKPFNLNMHTARLLMREPFFAALSRRIDKTPSKSVPTAGVRVTRIPLSLSCSITLSLWVRSSLNINWVS